MTAVVNGSTGLLYLNGVLNATAMAGNGGSSSNMTPSPTALSYQGAVTYDLDGNMTSDSGWTYTWDGENRLAAMEIVASAPSSAKRRVEFEYDWQGRRIGKKSYTHNGSGYVLQTQTTFFYDGWNLLMELDGSNVQQRSYVWGLDLSGSLHGAGGVGGLLMVVPSSATAQFVASDGNGNVTGLVDTTSGAFTTWYEYGPFGEPIRGNGLLAKGNPYRWSSKFTDDESDLVYYGHRYYNPHTGRWPNRDPIGEEGGVNLYGFVANQPTLQFDPRGLESWLRPMPPSSLVILPGGAGPSVDRLFGFGIPESTSWISEFVPNGFVPKCVLAIYVGHANKLPRQIRNANCSAASANSCFGTTIPVDLPIPGIDPRTDEFQTLSLNAAFQSAVSDVQKARDHAKNLCKGTCCKKVYIYLDGSGLSTLERRSFEDLVWRTGGKTHRLRFGVVEMVECSGR